MLNLEDSKMSAPSSKPQGQLRRTQRNADLYGPDTSRSRQSARQTARSQSRSRAQYDEEIWLDEDSLRDSKPQRPPQKRKSAPSKKSRRKKRRPGILAWIISLIMLAAGGYLIFELIRLDILPMMYLIILAGAVLIISILLVFIWLFKTRRTFAKSVCAILTISLGTVYAAGGYYVKATETMFDDITTLANRTANVFTVYSLKGNNLYAPKDIKSDMIVGIIPTLDQNGTQAALDQLRSKGANFQTETFTALTSMVDALYDNEVQAIVFPENYHYQIYEIANDENRYNALTTFSNVTDTYMYYTQRDPSTLNPSDPVANVMTDPFAVLISGNDSYGSIDSVARSDVNMIIVVNPKTAQILTVSIPRDAYVPISCRKDTTACTDFAGVSDKLTHTGILGVGVTESTIEDLLDSKINYYVRVNFSSLINLVDAVGGIDVDVPEGQEVETFYANGEPGVHAGMNHLEGERALAFARERHAYVNGDLQRIQNQSMVMRALIQKCMSPSMFVNYPKVVKAVSTAIDTNFSANELKSLVTLEIARRPAWTIQSYALIGNPVYQYSPLLGTQASVTELLPSSIEYARRLIEQVEAGQTVTVDPNGADDYYEMNLQDSQSQESIQTDIYGNPITGQTQQYDMYGNPITDQNQQYDAYGNPIGGQSQQYGTNTDPSAQYDAYGNPITDQNQQYDMYGNPIDPYDY